MKKRLITIGEKMKTLNLIFIVALLLGSCSEAPEALVGRCFEVILPDGISPMKLVAQDRFGVYFKNSRWRAYQRWANFNRLEVSCDVEIFLDSKE